MDEIHIHPRQYIGVTTIDSDKKRVYAVNAPKLEAKRKILGIIQEAKAGIIVDIEIGYDELIKMRNYDYGYSYLTFLKSKALDIAGQSIDLSKCEVTFKTPSNGTEFWLWEQSHTAAVNIRLRAFYK